MKKYIAVISAAYCILLSGCSAENSENMPEELMKKYLLRDNEQYNEYLSMKKIHSENIDANGYYVDDIIARSEIDSHPGAVHVSFATNSLLNVTYYTDSEHKDTIDVENCYLYPGDTIYTTVDTTSFIQSNTYEFQGFQMAVFDGEQSNFNYSYFEGDTITIPNEIQYKEISIIPNGTYKRRNLTFQAEYKDIDGNTLSISPLWIIDVGEQKYSTKSDSYSIDANSSFHVEAQFDPNEYYYIEDEIEPKCETSSDVEGKVIFPQYNAQNAINDYKLVFGKKFNITIDNISATGPITIWIDGEKYDNPTFPMFESAKLGAEVRIESSGEITSIGTTKNLIRLTQNGYVYSVYNESETFEFDPSAYTYSNGKVTFFDSDHNQIIEKTNLNIGDVIYYVGEANDGFAFNMGDNENKINVDSNIDYMLKNELKFTPKQKIDLPQPEKGGTIIYYLNGKEIKDNTSYFAAGTDKLTASFNPLERYKANNISDQAECVVSASDHRIRFKDNDGNEITVDEVFELSSSQKAKLTVKLDDSVGTEIKFNIYNGTELKNKDNKSYISKAGLDKKKLLDGEEIETVSGIKITVSDWSPLKNEALKIDVTKKDNSNKKIKEIYYIVSGSGSQIINTDSGNSAYYKEIDIEICKVEGSFFNENDYTYDNGKLDVYYDDISSNAQIKNGEFVDNSRKVRMVLLADNKYHVYKKKTLGKKYEVVDKYEATCKYKDLDEEFLAMKSKTKIQH